MSKFHKNILIICEGQDTEPQYFRKIRDFLIEKNVDIAIEIRPRPSSKAKKEKKHTVRPGGKLKVVKESSVPIDDVMIEEQYVAQPLRYVREAQIGIETNLYDEVWAVFDKDGHTKHKEAFELAEKKFNNKKVNIGFSSIAFEYWVLLHFETNNTSFEKSLCRTTLANKQKEYFFCGTQKHLQDCNGQKCVGGRIISQKYLEYMNNRKEFNYEIYSKNVVSAIERAYLLRQSYTKSGNPNLNIYDLNPYTSIDRLVFKLLNLDKYDIMWTTLSEDHIINDLQIHFNPLNSLSIHVKISPLSDKTIIFLPEHLCLFHFDGSKIDCGERKVIQGQDTDFIVNLNSYAFKGGFMGLNITGNSYSAFEIP